MMKLSVIDVAELDIKSNHLKTRQDLHFFMGYVQERSVKRAYRGNLLAKSDYNRLAKLVSDPDAREEIKEDGNSSWIDYIDELALTLGFVNYDTEGEYVGYSSQEPTFRDNYIEPNYKVYGDFLELSLSKQEQKILHVLIKDLTSNEFIHPSGLGRLNKFNSFGSGRGVLPTLDFPKARMFLLDLLHQLDPDTWYSTKSLIEYLKSKHRYFLIPKKPKVKIERWRTQKNVARYGNFCESDDPWRSGEPVPDDAPDGFERVEGRYVERFLEGIPLTLGYVELAYDKNPSTAVYPSINELKAFRIKKRFKQAMKGNIPKPRVTIQPNFEIQIDSPFYPATIMAQLGPISKVISVDTLITLKLEKKKVTALLAEEESSDIIGLLKQLAGNRLPQNVLMELQEWAGDSEKFVLFNGFFGILEGTEAGISAANAYIKTDISPTIKLINEPSKAFRALQQAELVPLRMTHTENAFRQLPETSQTVFATKSLVAKPKEKPSAHIRRESTVTLYFPNTELLDRFCRELILTHAAVEPDKSRHAATFSTRYETEANAVMKVLGKEYNIKIEEI